MADNQEEDVPTVDTGYGTDDADQSYINKELPYFSMTGPTKELPGTHAIIHGIRGAVHGLLPVAEKMEAGIDTGFQKIAEMVGGEKAKPYSQNEQTYLGQLEQARKESPLVTGASELGGAIFSPINKLVPGLGAGGIAKGVVKGTAQLGSRGALGGALQGGASYIGETPTDKLSLADAAKASAMSGAVGGGLGTVGGGVLGRLAQNKDKYLVQALASSKGDVMAPGKAIGAKTSNQAIDKITKIARGAEEQGIIGQNLGQNITETNLLAKAKVDEFGKQTENLRNAITTKVGNKNVGHAGKVVDDVMNHVEGEMISMGRLSPGEKTALVKVRESLEAGLMNESQHGYQNLTPVNMNDLRSTYNKVKIAARGLKGSNDVAANETRQALATAQTKLQNIFLDEADKVTPDLAAKLRSANANYHIARSAMTATGSGKAAELGSRTGGGLLGRVAGMSSMMLGKVLGKPGQLAGRMLGNQLSQRAVAANTALRALSEYAPRLPGVSRVAGAYTGKAMTPDTSGGDY